MKRNLSLRGFLLVLLATGAVYVGAIALLITGRIGPVAGSLGRQSELSLAARDSIGHQLAELKQSINDVHRLVVQSREDSQPSLAARPLVGALRARLDRLASMQYASILEAVTPAMRVTLAAAAESESDLGMALLRALDAYRLGRLGDSYESLRLADQQYDETAQLLAAAERIGLADIMNSERRLAAQARFAGRAVLWWLTFGLLLVPLLLWMLRRRVHEPLAELDQALSRVGDGQLDITISPRRHDEIGRLALKFNGMSSQLRARSEEERRRSDSLSERLGQLLDESSNAIVLFDGASLRIVQASRGAGEQFGYQPGELRDRGPADLLPPDGAQRFLEEIAEMRSRNRPAFAASMPLVRRDGSTFPALINVQASSSEPLMFLMVAQDMTGHHEAEQLREALRESQRLESVGRLAGGVAHDFNNLLTAVLSHAEFLGEALPTGHEGRPDLEGIVDASQRAASLTRQLLAFARRQVAEPRVLDLNEITRKADKLLRRLMGEDIELVTLLDPSLRRTRIDPTHFEQVLVNLAVNARDAMPEGGRLVIRSTNVHLDGAFARRNPEIEAGRYVLLTVQDTGTGMDETTRARIFEPFFTTKEQGKGTGLGLATAYGIVRQAGGLLAAESSPGKGATFLVYLPVADGDPATMCGSQAEQTPSHGRETILLVEDQPQIRRLLARGLRNKGYHVLPAGNGTEALEIARGHAGRIELLVTDVVMPLLSGRELARQLAEERPDTTVLFMSGYAEEIIAQRGILEYGVALLSKPFTAEELALKVREVLDRVGAQLAGVAC